MKKSFLPLLLISGLAGPVNGQLLLEENFNYPDGEPLSEHGWNIHSGSINAVIVTPPTIQYPGYPASGTGNETTLNKTGQDVNHTFTTLTGGDIYISFLINVASATLTGDYFLHLGGNPMGSSFKGKVFVRRDGQKRLSFGISQSTHVTALIAWSPFIYSLNTVYLLVLKYSMVPGSGNDMASLFINPDPGLPEPAERLTSCDTPADPGEIGSVALRQGGASSGPMLQLDGLRTGLSWSDLFSAVPDQLIVTGTVAEGQSICYNARQTIDVGGASSAFILVPGGTVTMISGQRIFFHPGINLRFGGQLSASITTEGNYCSGNKLLPGAVTRQEGLYHTINEGKDEEGPYPFPNPTKGVFSLDIKTEKMDEHGFAAIYRITGEPIMKKEFDSRYPPMFDLSEQPAGIYFLKVVVNGKSEMAKIIKF